MQPFTIDYLETPGKHFFQHLYCGTPSGAICFKWTKKALGVPLGVPYLAIKSKTQRGVMYLNRA